MMLGSGADSLVSAGADVVDLGIVPTPMVYYAKRRLQADGCAIVTASHNPPDDNGLIVWIGLPDGGVAMRAEAGF